MQNDENKNGNLINPLFEKRGYIQVYTGKGKGKTTASLGLAMRALGRGWKVLIVMFTKGGDDYGELYSFTTLKGVMKNKFKIINAGSERIVYANNINVNDYRTINEGWQIAKNAIQSNEYQLIILDEANIALDLGLIKLDDMLETLKNKPDDMEIVLTGRNAKPEIIEIAHLVSEIHPVKHYWDKGITARKGIEF